LRGQSKTSAQKRLNVSSMLFKGTLIPGAPVLPLMIGTLRLSGHGAILREPAAQFFETVAHSGARLNPFLTLIVQADPVVGAAFAVSA
jgi:hypothetical protein